MANEEKDLSQNRHASASAGTGTGSKPLGRSKPARWRFWVQLGFLAAWLDPLLMRMHTVCGPVFHCYSCPLATFACPIGVLANFSALHLVPFLALGTLALVGTVLGSFVCGWVCPFGFLQDLLAKIPTPKFHIPDWMGFLRYAVLAGLVIAIPYWYGEGHDLFFCRVCPAGALEAGLPNTVRLALNHEEVSWPTPTKLAILGAVLGASLFAWRPWCTLFCPLGAVYSIFNRVSFLYMRFHGDRCIGCKTCRSLCKAGGSAEQRVDGTNCVRCLECTRCRAVSVATVFSPETPKRDGGAINATRSAD